MTSALTDQMETTRRNVELRCGRNSHLIEDPDIDVLVRDALHGGPTLDEMTRELQVGAFGPAVLLRTFRSRRVTRDARCDRCLDLLDAGRRDLDMPAGGSIVRLTCCSACVGDLDLAFVPAPHWIA